MNIGILDCKVGGQLIEETERYLERGYDVINAGALDKPRKDYDILASTWTQLSEKRLRAVGCRHVVVKDNDEPFNVIQQSTIDATSVAVSLIDLWGISTRVAWNAAQIERYAPGFESVFMAIVDSPSHEALAERLDTPDRIIDLGMKSRNLEQYDVVIVHLAKADFKKNELDPLLRSGVARKLLISTTRGAVFSAGALNHAIEARAPETAVLDWTWQQQKLDPSLIADKRIVLTNHVSYRSEDSKRELTDVTIEAVEKAIAKL